jgi:hypothetical protein
MKKGDRIDLVIDLRRRRGPLPAGDRANERRLAAAKLLATLSECRDWRPDSRRAARLKHLYCAVETGTYRIDYERTARAMLGEIIGEALA